MCTSGDRDEKTFEILQNKTQFLRRRDGEKFHSDCVIRTVKHPTKIMIWSVISGKGTGRLDVVKGMMRQDHASNNLARDCMYQIAAKVPCGLSTVVRTLKRFSETNFIVDRGRSGRPRKTSLREDRLLQIISLSNRKLNSSQILKQWTLTSNVRVCPRTVRGRLLEIGLRGCKVRPKPLLTEFQRKRRVT
ncbi:uncharacterized protein TNCV_2170011 [Trichonephila clavipes]|nr:uncharacterized protein TNCV_2170011 [Trichonephila clavipes]